MWFHLELVLGLRQRGDEVGTGRLQIEYATGVTKTPAEALGVRTFFDVIRRPSLGKGACEIVTAGTPAQDLRAKNFLAGFEFFLLVRVFFECECRGRDCGQTYGNCAKKRCGRPSTNANDRYNKGSPVVMKIMLG